MPRKGQGDRRAIKKESLSRVKGGATPAQVAAAAAAADTTMPALPVVRDDDDETGSVTSVTEEHKAEVLALDPSEALEQVLEQLSDKRRSTREGGYKTLATLLRHKVITEQLAGRYATACLPPSRDLTSAVGSAESVVSECLSSVRKGRGAEQLLAAKVIGLVAITMGASHEALYTLVAKPLQDASLLTLDHLVHAAAVQSLTLTCYFCNIDQSGYADLFVHLKGLMKARNTAPPVRAAAIRSLSFMFTTLTPVQLTGQIREMVPVLAALTQHDSQEVRVSAGECAGLLLEARREAENKDSVEEDAEVGDYKDADDDELDEYGDMLAAEADDDGDGDADADEEAEDSDSAAAAEDWDWMEAIGWEEAHALEGRKLTEIEEVLHTNIADMAVDNSKSRSRKARREQRAAIRAVQASLVRVARNIAGHLTSALAQRGVAPTTQIRVRSYSSTLRGWRHVMVYDMCRWVLASGLQNHLEFNPFVRDPLGLEGEVTVSRMSALEKRFYQSPNSDAVKARDADRAFNRSARNAMKTSFLSSDF